MVPSLPTHYPVLRRPCGAQIALCLAAVLIAQAGCASQNGTMPTDQTTTAFNEAGTWTSHDLLPDPVGGSAAAFFQGFIYVVGGYLDNRSGPAVDHVWRFDPVTMSVERLNAFPLPISEAAAVVLADTLLLIGGNITDELAPSARGNVWWYDAGADTWDLWTDMPDRRFRHTAQAVGNQVLVIGGENLTAPPDDSIVVLTDRTARYATPPNQSFANPVIGGVVRDTVVVMGSLFNTWVMRYDPSSGGWADAVLSPISGSGTGAVLDGRFHTFTVRPRPEHRIWTDADSGWHTAPPPPVPVDRAAAVPFDGRLFLIGGWNDERRAVTHVQIYSPPNSP